MNAEATVPVVSHSQRMVLRKQAWAIHCAWCYDSEGLGAPVLGLDRAGVRQASWKKQLLSCAMQGSRNSEGRASLGRVKERRESREAEGLAGAGQGGLVNRVKEAGCHLQASGLCH